MKTSSEIAAIVADESLVPGAPGALPSPLSEEEKQLQARANEIFAKFPDDLLLKMILDADTPEELMQLASVCKRWHYLVWDKYDKQALKNILKKIPDKKLFELLEKNSRASSLVGISTLLLDERIDINRRDEGGNTLLHYACGGRWIPFSLDSNPNIELAAFLLNKGADIKIANSFGFLPFHAAVHNADASMCGLLLQFQYPPESQINSKTLHQVTPLHMAHNAEIVEILTAHGAEIESLDKYGNTPFLRAVEDGFVDVVDCLIKHHANVNAVKEEILPYSRALSRLTALHIAAAKGNLPIVKLLVKNGANLGTRVDLYGTAKEMALHGGYYVKPQEVAAVAEYLGQVEKKLAELNTVRDQVLVEAARLENKFFKEKEKADVIRVALERAWQEVYPQIFEENSSCVELKYLLLNTDKDGMSVKQALALDFTPAPIASLLKFFGGEQNPEDPKNSETKNFTL